MEGEKYEECSKNGGDMDFRGNRGGGLCGICQGVSGGGVEVMAFNMSLIVGSVRYLLVTDRALEQGDMHGLKVSVETRRAIKQPGAVRARMSGGDAAVGAGLAKIPLGPCCLPLFSLLLYSTAPKTQES